jgi:hypothetical protein
MPFATVSLPVLPANRPLRLTPTDVSQFVRLEQCDRFLRFRLAERAGQKFMEEYDVIPQWTAVATNSRFPICTKTPPPTSNRTPPLGLGVSSGTVYEKTMRNVCPYTWLSVTLAPPC